MNDKAIQLIESLAAKLGTTAEYLWGILIKQAPITATTNLIMICLFVVFVSVYLKWLIGKLKDEDFDGDDNERYVLITIAGGLLSLLFTIVSLLTVPQIITAYLNPEYWALEQILNKL